MKLWGYYALHTFINSIRKMFRSTVMIVIAVMVGVGLIFGLSIGLIFAVIDSESGEDVEISSEWEGYGSESNDSEVYDTEAGFFDSEGNFYYYEEGYLDENGEVVLYDVHLGDIHMTTEEYGQMMLVVETAIAALVLLLLGIGAYTGRKKGSDIFTMADVNFLFTSPMKPQSVLLFRLSFQMLATFTGCIYLLFQIPNLMNTGLSLGACLIGFLVLVMIIIFQKLVSVWVYTISASNAKAGKYVLYGLIGVVAVLFMGTVVAFLSCGKNVWTTLELTWASKWSRWIPIVGWTKALVMNALNGNVIMAVLQFVLLLLGMCVLIYLIWQMKADFYEDAMAGAQQREELLLAAAEDRKAVNVNEDKKKKEKRKIKEKENIKGFGANVFFTKELLTRKRLSKFGFLTTTMEWYLVISVAGAFFSAKILEMEHFTVSGFVLMVILFFRNYGNPIAQETSKNWLFMVPESAYKKVFFAMAAGAYAAFMDLLPGMVIAMIILGGNPLEILLWMVVLVSMDFMLSGVGMMLEALFPADALSQIKASLQLILKFFMILVIVVVIIIGVVIQGVTLGLILNLILNIAIGALAFIIYPSMLHEGIA